MSIFWSSWITIISLLCWLSILGVLLYVLRSKPTLEEDGTTGHIYDGIQEYDKPLPKWWLGIFFGSIVWAVGYWIFFPALFPHAFGGMATVEVGGEDVSWTSRNELYSELEANNRIFVNNFQTQLLPNETAINELSALNDLQLQQPIKSERSSELEDQINEQLVTLAPYVVDLSKNPKALMAGERLFLQNCAVCHGSNAKGAVGYPNLTDDDWLHGGEPENILYTLHNGWHTDIDVETDILPMPAQRDDIGEKGVRAAAEYVLSISGNQNDYELDDTKVAQGEAIFSQKCVICHGEDAKGTISAGAPNLTDNVWLFGGDRETIRDTLRYGRNGVMPEWETKLGNERIMLVAAYVYSFSGNSPQGETSQSAMANVETQAQAQENDAKAQEAEAE